MATFSKAPNSKAPESFIATGNTHAAIAPARRPRALFRASFLCALAMALLFTVSAWAQSLNELRAQGVVGERYDGYAVIRVENPPPGTRSFIDEVNAKRRDIYTARAREQGVPVDQVGRVYARQIFEEVPAGTWFLDEAGRWVRK